MGTSAGQVYTPFSLTGASSAPVSTPFSLAPNTSGYDSAMSQLNSSTDGLNTNFSLGPMMQYQSPGYQNLGANIPWNVSASDFGNPAGTNATNGNGTGNSIWSDVGNFFSGIYDHLKGGMEGLAAGYAGYQPPAWEKTQPESQDTTGQSFQREFDMSGLGGIANALKEGWNGLTSDPQQAQQDYQQSVVAPFNSMPAVPRVMNQFVTDTATDPLTYVPVGTIARVTGITPALKFGYDWAKGAIKGAGAVGDVAKGAEEATQTAAHAPVDQNMESLINSNGKDDFHAEDFGAQPSEPIKPVESVPNAAPESLAHDENFSNLFDHLDGVSDYEIPNTPFGAAKDAEQAAEEAATAGESASAAAKGNPYAAYDWQSKLGKPLADMLARMAPNGVPGLKQLFNGTENILGKAFVKYHGVSQPIVDSLKNALGQRASDRFYIQKAMTDLAKSHGLTEAEAQQIPHVLEGTATNVDPRIQSAADDLKNVLHNGIELPNGERILGTNHELNINGLNGKPILNQESLRQNYFPHIYQNSQKEINAAFTKNGNRGISTTGPHNMERTFDTVQDAKDAGLKPQMNPYKAIGQRLENSSKAIRNAELLNALTKSGALVKGDTVDNIIKDVKTGKSNVEDAINNAFHTTGDTAKSGMVQSKIPQLRGYFMTPTDEAALRDFVEPGGKGPLLGTLSKMTSWYKKFALLNPMVHFHNIETNGRYLGNANGAYAREAKQAIKNNVADPWYMKALRDGAISQDSGRGFAETLNKSIDKVNAPKSLLNTLKNAKNTVTHDALWNEDKALRVALYRQGYEEAAAKGLGDAEAGKAGAALANKYMVNYDNLTPFEKTYVAHLFGFYPWTKGNTMLQADQWMNNTGKMMAYERAKDSVAQALTGQDANDKGRIDSGQVLSDGNHVYIDPYSPIDELPKMFRDGAGPYLYGKLNPYLKTGINLATNHTINPWDNSPIWKNGAPTSANLQSEAGTVLNNLNPFGGGIAGNAVKDYVKDKPPMTTTEALTQLAGGFSSRGNPLLDAYYKQKDAQTNLQGQIKYDKANSIPVSKQDVKNAYKKIPYPAITPLTGN